MPPSLVVTLSRSITDESEREERPMQLLPMLTLELSYRF